MLDAYAYAIADREYYAPPGQAPDAGRHFSPTVVPQGWTADEREIWTHWSAPGVVTPDEGWKVHVSSRLERADAVLDTVAHACFAQGVAFKHVSAELFFLLLHHKHGAREQAGKFCAAFPADEAAARRLMEHLAAALADEEGPYVLSDRRFGDSRTVHYRWGAFRPRARQRPDGTLQWLARDRAGRDIVDTRKAAFALPEEHADPFAASAPAPHRGPVVLRDYEIVRAIRISNAGGAYEARDVRSGQRVFIKEARAHNGLYWDGSTAQERLRREYDVLRELHDARPGLAPEPLAYFREWEHEFLATEFVEGTPLNAWMAERSPAIQARGRVDHTAYYADAERILRDVDAALDALHALGFIFGDLNPGNVLVTGAGGARLIDFEAASPIDQRPLGMGVDGYVPPDGPDAQRPLAWDHYGAGALALALLMPLHGVVRRSPGNLPLLRRDLERDDVVPEPLWGRATRIYPDEPAPHVPTAAELDAQPLESLQRFAAGVRRALVAMAESEHPDRIFPTVRRGYETNSLCVAYGAAGVLHALHLTGSVPGDALERFRRDATAAREALVPGLHVGSAGVAWVLAELGQLDEALDVLACARRHPLAASSVTLGEGAAGLALAQLALHHRTGDPRLLEQAAAVGDALASDPAPLRDDAVGLLHGRAGLAWFLHHLARDTGEQRYRDAGRRLLREELSRAVTLPDGALSFSDGVRALPYLNAGSAGVALVLARYLDDEPLAAARERILLDVDKTCTILPGLYCGLAGLAFALAEQGDRDDAALRVATGLVKYAIAHPSGVRFLGDESMRFSAELWSGGAGVLVGLQRVLHGPADHFFSDPRPTPKGGE